MTKPQRPSLWRRLMGLPVVAGGADAGDMGTAMGMEYSMDQTTEQALGHPSTRTREKGSTSLTLPARSGPTTRRRR